MDSEKHKKASLKTTAFIAIALSTVAVTGCLITFPLVFNYVQALEASVQNDLDFCRAKAKNMWQEMLDIQIGARGHNKRIARAAVLNGNPEDHFERVARQATGCCTCNYGPPGPAGQPGRDGADGIDGLIGEIGSPGPQAQLTPDMLGPAREQCPCQADKGPPGRPGNRGAPGNPGNDGNPGEQGKGGDPGQPGSPGNKGPPGNPGSPGQPGAPGVQRPGDRPPPGSPGQPGRPGQPGNRGPPGRPGNAGNPGGPGQPGPPGNAGRPGSPGQPGSPGEGGDPGSRGRCDHCPPPRLASGY